MRQWMMRITAYADRLIDDLDLLDWSDAIKTMQRNWIGRSPGAWVHFASPAGEIVGVHDPARHAVRRHVHGARARAPVRRRADHARARRQPSPSTAARRPAKKDIDRQDENREKTGVFTGSYAVNPVNGEQIPVWIADYVLMGYGTGAIMAVPCGDQRDFEFARKFGLPIPAIQKPPQAVVRRPGHRAVARHVDVAVRVRRRRAVRQLGQRRTRPERHRQQGRGRAPSPTRGSKRNGAGEATITYKLRDWLFSRQRYWGEPFPIVYDVDGNPHALPDEMLPVELPETDSFSPRTFDPDDEFSNPESPLDRLTDWVEVTLDLGDGPQAVPPRHERDAAVGRLVLVPAALPRPHQRERFVDPDGRALLDRAAHRRPPRPSGRRRPVRRRRRARRAAPAVRPVLAQGAVRPRPPVVEGAVRPAVQPGLRAGRGVQGPARDLRRRLRGRGARRRLLLRGRAGHPRDGQDGQEPQERRVARRHVRRRTAPTRCACT